MFKWMNIFKKKEESNILFVPEKPTKKIKNNPEDKINDLMASLKQHKEELKSNKNAN